MFYVDNEGRIREFKQDRKYKQEIPLASIPGREVQWLAVDPNRDIYLIYGEGEGAHGNGIYELNPPPGTMISKFRLTPRPTRTHPEGNPAHTSKPSV